MRCRCRVLVNMTNIDLFIAACSCECSVILTNTSDVPVEHIDVTSSSRTAHDQHLVNEVINWNVANLKAQLPIRPKSQAVLTVYFNGALPLADDTARVRIQLATKHGTELRKLSFTGHRIFYNSMKSLGLETCN